MKYLILFSMLFSSVAAFSKVDSFPSGRTTLNSQNYDGKTASSNEAGIAEEFISASEQNKVCKSCASDMDKVTLANLSGVNVTPNGQRSPPSDSQAPAPTESRK